jgi:energy-coupling factor transporter ATP-binding protein EcfA2
MIELSGRPLRDTRRDRELFVEREAEVNAIRAALGHGGNVLLLGARGSGKSSLLNYVQHLLEVEDARPVVAVDGRTATTAQEFLALLRDRLNVLGSSNDPQLNLWPSRTETQTLLGALTEMRAALPEVETVVLVDEMPSAEAARTLFGRLRDELWELPLTWCVAADIRDRGAYTEPPADAFWRKIVELPPLTPEQSEELLRRRLEGEQPSDALQWIVENADGNPRRLLSLAHDVVVEGSDPNELMAEQRKRAAKVEQLSEPARRLLAELEAGGPASPSDEGLLQRLGWSRARASQVFGELLEHGLVRASTAPSAGSRPRRLYEVER